MYSHRPLAVASALFFRVAAASLGLALAACGGVSGGGSSEPTSVRLPSNGEGYQRFDQEGCPFISESRVEIACWVPEVDMGFGSIGLEVIGAAAQEATQRWSLYVRGDGDEGWHLDPEAREAAQRYLEAGAFELARWNAPFARHREEAEATLILESTRGPRTVSLSGLAPGDEEGVCCGWRVEARRAEGNWPAVWLEAVGTCAWIDEAGHPCQGENQTDESSSARRIRVLYVER